MGNSDRMQNYISDYLENSLDPSTQKEFEDALKKSPELRSMTDRMATLSARLNKLDYHKCSDNFSVKLREKIHTSTEPLISRQNVVRYSFAASFVIILVVATFTLTNLLSESSDTPPAIQGSSQNPVNNTNPATNPVSGTDANTFNDEGEMDVNTKPNQKVVSDSIRVEQEQKKPPIKYIDKKE